MKPTFQSYRKQAKKQELPYGACELHAVKEFRLPGAVVKATLLALVELPPDYWSKPYQAVAFQDSHELDRGFKAVRNFVELSARCCMAVFERFCNILARNSVPA